MDELITRWEKRLRLSGSARTVVTYGWYVRRWVAWCAAEGIDPQQPEPWQVEEWLLAHDWTAPTRKSARSALASLYRYASSAGRAADPMPRVARVSVPRCVPHPADDAALARGLAVPDEDVRLMVGLCGLCGLRRSEVAQVHTRDLMLHGLVVHGKGGRDRVVPLPGWMRAVIDARDRWVFPGGSGGHVCSDLVYRRVREATGVAPHTLRHRFATRAYAQTGDLLAVQQLLGHASVATTQGYVLLDAARLRSTAEGAWRVA
jgi:integrase